MQENKEELELLREHFEMCTLMGVRFEELEDKILEVQKRNKLKDRILYIQSCLSVGDEKEFNEILKELGYSE
tara:strand:- start:309 stop:524 length:216 start_codon:yes stop_codon:yes gene_type:complete